MWSVLESISLYHWSHGSGWWPSAKHQETRQRVWEGDWAERLLSLFILTTCLEQTVRVFLNSHPLVVITTVSSLLSCFVFLTGFWVFRSLGSGDATLLGRAIAVTGSCSQCLFYPLQLALLHSSSPLRLRKAWAWGQRSSPASSFFYLSLRWGLG